MAEGQHRLMKVGESRNDRTAVPATAHHQDTNRPFQQLRIETMHHHCLASRLFKYWFNVSSSTSVDSGNRCFPAKLLQSAVVPPRRFVRRLPPPWWVNSLWKKACCHAAMEVTVNDFGVRIVPAQTELSPPIFQ